MYDNKTDSNMTRKEIYKSRFRSLNTAEKKRILSRLFPDGYIECQDNIPDEQTFAGYTEDFGLIEVRFSLFDSRIDISREFETEREKWLFINDITNRALAKNNVYTKQVQKFPFDNDSYYFVADMNEHKFFIGLNQNKPQAI